MGTLGLSAVWSVDGTWLSRRRRAWDGARSRLIAERVVEAVKARLRETQLRAALDADRELLGMDRNFGRAISVRVEAGA